MRRILIIFIATSYAFAQPNSPEYDILFTGKFHGDEILFESGSTWFGLFNIDGTFELLPTKVSILPCHDPVVDENETQESGKEVKTDRIHQAVFLIRTSRDLEPGKIETVYHGTYSLALGSTLDISFDEENYQIRAYGDCATSDEYSSVVNNYRIVISSSRAKQVIVPFDQCCDDKFPRLLWAGDLDRDNNLDFLIDTSNHYNMSANTLYLSSEADAHTLVKEVAVFTSVGC